jgi:hypothetical protein
MILFLLWVNFAVHLVLLVDTAYLGRGTQSKEDFHSKLILWTIATAMQAIVLGFLSSKII